MTTVPTRQLIRITVFTLTLSAVCALLLARAQAAPQYDQLVTNCSEVGLNNALYNIGLSGGGSIGFSCPPNTTIPFNSGYKTISYQTSIDGSNNGKPITLNGLQFDRLFFVPSGVSFTLTHIILRDGFEPYPYSGGCLAVDGSLYADDVQMMGCIANSTNGYGGAIYMSASGKVRLNNTLMRDGSAYAGGGIYNNNGILTITLSTLSNNVAGTSGGGIYNGGVLTLTNSTLNDNRSSQQGGGVSNFGAVRIVNTTLSGNHTNGQGGGIFSEAGARVFSSTIGGNTADNGGGGVYNDSGIYLVGSTLDDNHSTSGGGIYSTFYGTAYFTNTTVSRNTASNNGGGIYNGGFARLENSTVSGNSAVNSGGGLYHYGETSRLRNATFANNSASSGGALYINADTVVMTNTILAYSPAGGNCAGLNITLSKFTLSSDNSCALPAGHTINGHNPNLLDPLLTALGNYGGPTLVHMLKSGSPAIAGIVGSDAPLTDQRGKPRPGGDGSYDLGAVERQSSDSNLAPRLYLPMLRR